MPDDAADRLRTSLLTLLDQVDYTTGACRPNEMVGAVLPKEVIEMCHKTLAETQR
ncbi:MAG TPA: hypothetical protein VNW90_15700 [Acetobacteraceae bacterium]|nr:hypothetical protein [Acetobacteraceae bacterium]